ncbi:hypothetical protein HGRIS_003512 [Hohenbuehelia grisea]|uniref:Cytochrome P450 n=1 Tax=Hohenbuehelia grisea TaxID=104357 RepID=A0ABR3JG59_9AGAR
MSVLALAVALCILASTWFKLRSRHRHQPPLPPGPPADPLIGHLRVIPTKDQGSVFHKWAQTYGDVLYVNALGRSMVILDSITAATDLLEKRSSNYSDRPRFPVIELLGYDPNLVLMPYGDRFRKHRKIIHSNFTKRACLPWRDLQKDSAYNLALSLLDNGENYDRLFSWFTTAVITKIAYGFDVKFEDDEYVQMAEHNGFVLNEPETAGGTVVDLLPFLRHFPSWFPGTQAASFAREWRWAIRRLYDLPFEKVKREWDRGTAGPSLLAAELAKLDGKENDEDLEDLKGASAMAFIAGAETTWSALVIFLLAMVRHPDIQRRAQEEIDRVTGPDRLPDFSDQNSLPFVECLVQEVLRWHPVVPLGIPHRCMEEDIYRNMFIPKGSIVIANLHGMALDESVYSDPTSFNPSRFLPKPIGNEEPLFQAAFGFGRRACPGMHLALAGLWIVMVTILATADISKATDKDGNTIEVEPDYTNGLASRPKPFPCRIQSRSEQRRDLLAKAIAASSK